MTRFISCSLLLLAIGCGSSNDSNGGGNNDTTVGTYANCTSTNATAATAVTLSSIAFSPSCIKLSAGDAVVFTNQDSVTHTVTSDSGDTVTFSSPDMNKSATYSQTFATAGTYKVHCNYHSSMHLTIIVN